MKLRFHDNSLRLRLSRTEVANLAEKGLVEETITFAPGQTLVYALESAAANEVSAGLEGNRVRVLVPQEQVAQWAGSELVGIESEKAPLHILIEKDFECLHREPAQNADAFPNPLADKF